MEEVNGIAVITKLYLYMLSNMYRKKETAVSALMDKTSVNCVMYTNLYMTNC